MKSLSDITSVLAGLRGVEKNKSNEIEALTQGWIKPQRVC